MIAMTLPIARELSRQGIRLMTIAPGIMETPCCLGMPSEVGTSARWCPSLRLGQPTEFAGLVRHILENTYLNGEVIRPMAPFGMARTACAFRAGRTDDSHQNRK